MSLLTPPPQTSEHRSLAPSPTSTLSPTANSVTTNDLLKIIVDLQNQINKKPPSFNNTTKPKNFIRNHVDHYCWTHGVCGHDSKDCRNKKPGHQDSATFDNKLGGSTFFCKDKNTNNPS